MLKKIKMNANLDETDLMNMANTVVYNATETASLYHSSTSSVKGLIGCVGCGKSVSSCIQVMTYIISQEPCPDGIRRSRWAITRNTYPELKATTIKTWSAWFPEEIFGKIKYDAPINQRIIIDDIDAEIFFLSLNSPDDVKKLKSFELTGVYINEMQFIDQLLFKTCRERTNRYPGRKEGVKPTWSGVLWDANPPPTLHWMYDTFEKHPPKEFATFHYKPALLVVDRTPDDVAFAISKNDTIYISNPEADFIKVQNDPKYWLKLVPGNSDESIKVDLLGQYGVVISGRAVHSSYNDKLHYAAKPLAYDPTLELGLGFDFGLTPACAIVQQNSYGQLQMLDEQWSQHMGLRDFLRNVVIPHLDTHFKGWRENYYSCHDPSGSTGSQTDARSCQDILKEEGIISHAAADNNDPTLRRDALKQFLSRLVDGQPAFLLSDKCLLTREGLLGNFQYPRVQAGGDPRYLDKPVKNIYSHICEGLEYIAIYYSTLNKRDSVKKIRVKRFGRSDFMSR